jgi:hypothetical protein
MRFEHMSHSGSPTELRHPGSPSFDPTKGEYLRWGDWSKTNERTDLSGVRGRLDAPSYHRDPFTDRGRLKISNYGVDSSGKLENTGQWKYRHDRFTSHAHPGNWSPQEKQSVNINKMNFLGSGVFSIPKK